MSGYPYKILYCLGVSPGTKISGGNEDLTVIGVSRSGKFTLRNQDFGRAVSIYMAVNF
jgi:hypothetical protein